MNTNADAHITPEGRNKIEGGKMTRTPGARVGVIDCRVHVAQIDLAHETIDLRHGARVRVAGKRVGAMSRKLRLTLSCREKLAKRD